MALQPSKIPLVDINGSPVWPLCRVFLYVTVGSVMLTVEFIVVKF